MTPYKLLSVQLLKDTNKPGRCDFCIAMQEKLGDNGFHNHLAVSDEATFHVNGKINKHNTSIGGTETHMKLLNITKILQR